MRFEVKLPSLGEDADDEAFLSFWLAAEGEEVRKGDDLAELTTDKAAFTLPSPKKGVVVEHVAEEDETVRAGDVMCIMEV